jgi:tetratricopeptide (TPR) repeat protein
VGEDPHHIYAPGFSSYLESLAKRGAIRSELGRQAEGAADVERALRLAQDAATPRDTQVFCLMMDGFLRAFFGATSEAAARARRLVQLADDSAGPFFVEVANSSAGMANAALGRWEEAIGQLERCLREAGERGAKVWNEPGVRAELSNAYRAVGRLADARTSAEAGVAAGLAEGMRPAECRAQIALARVLIAEGESNDAIETALLRAEALVEETRARAYLPFIGEARAALAQLRGDAPGAVRALSEAHDLFSEMGALGHVERVAKLLAEPLR